jgi:hypothetical protein
MIRSESLIHNYISKLYSLSVNGIDPACAKLKVVIPVPPFYGAPVLFPMNLHKTENIPKGHSPKKPGAQLSYVDGSGQIPQKLRFAL